jgi:hypothetical protein
MDNASKSDYRFQQREDADITIYRHYTIGVELSARTRLPDRSGPELQKAIDHTRKLIAQEVFGGVP